MRDAFDDNGRVRGTCRRAGRDFVLETGLAFVFARGRHAVITMFEDNQGAVNIAQNPIANSNSKHIDVTHYFIRNW